MEGAERGSRTPFPRGSREACPTQTPPRTRLEENLLASRIASRYDRIVNSCEQQVVFRFEDGEAVDVDLIDYH